MQMLAERERELHEAQEAARQLAARFDAAHEACNSKDRLIEQLKSACDGVSTSGACGWELNETGMAGYSGTSTPTYRSTGGLSGCGTAGHASPNSPTKRSLSRQSSRGNLGNLAQHQKVGGVSLSMAIDGITGSYLELKQNLCTTTRGFATFMQT
jgi:hypothetical protein